MQTITTEHHQGRRSKALYGLIASTAFAMSMVSAGTSAVLAQGIAPTPDISHVPLDRLGKPSFDEAFETFDHGTDQNRPAHPHRWRTVYGYGGATSAANRQMSAGSFASDEAFPGVSSGRLGSKALGLNPFIHHRGSLTIQARPTPRSLRPVAWNKPYYGGAITTKFSFQQKYGYFEIEAKLPAGKGMWPAFWLMPVDGHWPDAGEIDILEGLGDRRTIFCTVIAGKQKKTTRVRLGFDASADFHRYGVWWDRERLVWFVDRKPVASAATPKVLTRQSAYVIANLAVGGSWGGYPDASTSFPGRYELRRVTVWPEPMAVERRTARPKGH